MDQKHMNILKQSHVIFNNDTLTPTLGHFITVVQARYFGLIQSYKATNL